MPGLRYRQPEVCDHLAAQYVAGSMTARVRARTETLIESTPELRRAVAFWADQFAELQYQLPESQPVADVWQNIAKATKPENTENWWSKLLQSLRFWQSAALIGAVASMALFAVVVITPVATPQQAPSYMAAMAPHQQAKADVHFVVTAYGKTSNEPSKLVVQWSKRHPRQVKDRLHLWAEDIQSGELTYLGQEPDPESSWHLTKARWQAVTNSSRLIMTVDQSSPDATNTLFSGQCVQLKSWKKESA